VAERSRLYDDGANRRFNQYHCNSYSEELGLLVLFTSPKIVTDIWSPVELLNYLRSVLWVYARIQRSPIISWLSLYLKIDVCCPIHYSLRICSDWLLVELSALSTFYFLLAYWRMGASTLNNFRSLWPRCAYLSWHNFRTIVDISDHGIEVYG